METDYKTIAVIATIVIALFAGGLYYVVQESTNRRVALGLMQEYLVASPEQQTVLEAEIRSKIENRPLAMTSRASFDSFEQLLANAKACDGYTEQALFNPRASEGNYEEIWLYCMDNPEVLLKK